jgi:ribosomal protein S18 acetylase RimI-like enzyme
VSDTGQAPASADEQLDVRLMTPEQRALAAMILADATAEGTEDAATRALVDIEQTAGSAIFIAWLSGLPIAAYVLTPAQMSVEMPLIAVRPEMRRRGIGTIVARDAVRRAGHRPVVAETSEELMPFFSAVGFKKFGRRKGPNGEVRYRVGWHTPGQRTQTA